MTLGNGKENVSYLLLEQNDEELCQKKKKKNSRTEESASMCSGILLAGVSGVLFGVAASVISLFG